MKLLKTLISAALILCVLLSPAPAALAKDGDPRFDGKTWEEVVEDFNARLGIGERNAAYGYRNTVTGEEHFFNADQYMVSASMYKVPLNMIVAEKVYEGDISFDTLIGGLSYRQLQEGSIIHSDNDFARVLWMYVGSGVYRSYRRVIAPLMGEDADTVDPQFYVNNYFTPRQMIHCLNELYTNAERYPGVIECMKPTLLLEDVASGKMTREEYIRECGHRSADEMELMSPRPYEDPSFIDALLKDREAATSSLHEMLERQKASYEESLAEFKEKYPSRRKWIDKELAKFVRANDFREDIRSKGVRIFCVFRQYCLKAGELNGIGEDIFMLGYKEMFALLKGDKTAVSYIPARKETFAGYLSYPGFPGVIIGRFDPDKWMEDPDRRYDYYVSGRPSGCDRTSDSASASDVKGFAGAAGVVTGKVRVINDVSRIDELNDGEILVTRATNIGWTVAFHKVSAIVTDIGAPLSHAAIVAREFGIPAVVGCSNATTVLKTGDVVTVDGGEGTVTIVDPA